jgi:hypothetical protein
VDWKRDYVATYGPLPECFFADASALLSEFATCHRAGTI